MDNIEGNSIGNEFIPELDFNEIEENPTTVSASQENEISGMGTKDGPINTATPQTDEEEEETIAGVITPDSVGLPVETEEPDGKNDKDTEFEYSEDENPTAVGIYKTMVQEGIIAERDDFKGSFDNIRDYISELPSRVARSLYDQAPEHGKAMLDYVFTKGQDLSQDDLKSFIATYLEDQESLSEPDFDSIESTEAFFRKSLSNKGLDASIIDATIEALYEKDPDGEVLKREARKEWDKESTNRTSKHSQELERIKQEKAATEQAQREFAKNIFESLDQTNWSPKKIQEVKTALANNTVQNNLKEIFSDPKAYSQLAAIVTLYDKSSKTFNLKDFVVQATSKAADEIKKHFIEDNFSSAGTRTKQVANPGAKEKTSIWDNLEPLI